MAGRDPGGIDDTMNTNTTGAKGVLDYVDMPTVAHAAIIAIAAILIYHFLFHAG